MEKLASNRFPIHDLLKTRWSPRAFSTRQIETAQLLSLFEAARWSPSGGNLQPWYFIVATSSDPETHSRFTGFLGERNMRWAKFAPILVLTVAKVVRPEGQPNYWAMYDLGQAVAHLNLQASATGLSIHQIGGFDREKTREQTGLPSGYEPVTMIAIGYQGDVVDLPEDLRASELEARSRKPIQEFVFNRNWNEPITMN